MRKFGLSAIASLTIAALTACSSDSAETADAGPAPTEVTIVGPWRAEEATAFEKVLDGFRTKSGLKVTYSGVPDVVAALTPRISAGSPPDLAILPAGNGFLDYTAQGALKPLTFMAEDLTANFDPAYVAQYSKDGAPYGFPTRADMGNVLLFNPADVKTPPATWSDLTALCSTAKKTTGKACTAGMGKDVWPLYLIWQATYVSTFGAEKYQSLLTGKIPFDDPSVAESLKRVSQFYSDDWTAGGTSGAMGAGLVDGLARVFGESSDALVAEAGSWGVGLVQGAINQGLVEGETIDYIQFPYEEAGKGAVLGNSDAAVLLVDNASTQQLAKYLASAEAQSLFIPSGFTVANKNADTSSLTGLKAKTAEFLKTGPVAAALIPNAVQNGFQEVIGQAIADPSKIDSLLKTFAPVAADGLAG